MTYFGLFGAPGLVLLLSNRFLLGLRHPFGKTAAQGLKMAPQVMSGRESIDQHPTLTAETGFPRALAPWQEDKGLPVPLRPNSCGIIHALVPPLHGVHQKVFLIGMRSRQPAQGCPYGGKRAHWFDQLLNSSPIVPCLFPGASYYEQYCWQVQDTGIAWASSVMTALALQEASS